MDQKLLFFTIISAFLIDSILTVKQLKHNKTDPKNDIHLHNTTILSITKRFDEPIQNATLTSFPSKTKAKRQLCKNRKKNETF